MPADKTAHQPPARTEALRALRAATRAWWAAVLAGQASQPYPTRGGTVHACVEDGTLIVTGTVPTGEDRREVAREVEHLKGRVVEHVRNELRVAPERGEEPGVLVQTLIGVFETQEQAEFADGYFEGETTFTPRLVQLLVPSGKGAKIAAAHAILPEAYWEEAERELSAGHPLLIVTVDETDAFRARELLEGETRNLRVLALPPEPVRSAQVAQHLLSHAETAGSGRRRATRRPRGERKRLGDSDRETTTHGP